MKRAKKQEKNTTMLWSIASRLNMMSAARILAYTALFTTILLLNIAIALAQAQNHPLSQVYPINTDLDMGSYQVNASQVNSTYSHVRANLTVDSQLSVDGGDTTGYGVLPVSFAVGGDGNDFAGSFSADQIGVYALVNHTEAPKFGSGGGAAIIARAMNDSGPFDGIFIDTSLAKYDGDDDEWYGVVAKYRNASPSTGRKIVAALASKEYALYGDTDNIPNTYAAWLQGNATINGSLFLGNGPESAPGFTPILSVGDGTNNLGSIIQASEYGARIIVADSDAAAAGMHISKSDNEVETFIAVNLTQDVGLGWTGLFTMYDNGIDTNEVALGSSFAGIAAWSDIPGALAGYFEGDVNITNSTSDAELCLNDVCRSTWPGGAGTLVSGEGSAGRVALWNDTDSLNSSTSLYWEDTDDRLGIGIAAPSAKLDIQMTTGSPLLRIGTVTTSATSNYAVAIGSGAVAQGAATSIGTNTRSTGLYSTSFGFDTDAAGGSATAMGESTNASGTYSVASGYNTTADQIGTFASGVSTQALGPFSVAMGLRTSAESTASFAFGSETISNGTVSTALGHGTIASGKYSLASGYGIEAQGDYAVGIALDDQTGTVISDSNTMAIMGGDVGIGTTSPESKLDVKGTIMGNASGGSIQFLPGSSIYGDIGVIGITHQSPNVTAVYGVYNESVGGMLGLRNEIVAGTNLFSGVVGVADVDKNSSTASMGVRGSAAGSGGSNYGGSFSATDGDLNYAVRANANSGGDSYAVYATASGGTNAVGIYAEGDDYAGIFDGNVNVTGNITSGTGTVFIDGENSHLGVGIKDLPMGADVMIYEDDGAPKASYLKLSNSDAGTGGSDGLDLGITSDSLASLWLYEAGELRFGTDDTRRMSIEADGKVGVGPYSPTAMFHVRNGTGGGFAPEGLMKLEDDVDTYLIFETGSDDEAGVLFADDGVGGMITYNHAEDNMTFNAGNSDYMYLTSSGTLVMRGNISPYHNDTYTLGTPDNVWQEVYVGPSSLHIGGNVVSNVGGELKWDGGGISSSGGTLIGNISGTGTLGQNVAAVFGTATAKGNAYGVVGIADGKGVMGQGALGVEGYGTGSYDFYASGPAQTNYGAASSIRWKTNIEQIPDALDKVMSIRGVYFDWIEEYGGQHDMGFIAEEVGEYVPEVVAYEDDGVYATGMDYGAMTPVLVEAIKELKSENDALKELICLDHPDADICQ